MPQCYQSIIVEAPVEKVWETLKDFHDMSWASGVIESCKAIGEKQGTEVGSRRVLNDAFYETLLDCDADIHRILYSIDDGPSPVSPDEVKNYIGQIQLKPVTLSGSTFVEWSSSWESETDEARDFCHQIYIALLKMLADREAVR